QPRENSGGYAHNKFLVWRRANKSQEVWTGSTNLSENGIFGHSNNAHLVRDHKVAEQYYDYFRRLEQDKKRKKTAEANVASNAAPVAIEDEVHAVFSPVLDLAVLDWYAELAGSAKHALFATFASGMNERLVDIYGRKDNVLRYALMEKKGNGRDFREQ